MITEFVAQLGGKLVKYPMNSTFIVEEKKGRKFSLMASRETISAALSKFHRMQAGGKKVRLSACFEGRSRKLAGV